jgi:hypothetical protein
MAGNVSGATPLDNDGEVIGVGIVWPKTGFCSSRRPARIRSKVMMLVVVRDTDMARPPGTASSVLGALWVLPVVCVIEVT